MSNIEEYIECVCKCTNCGKRVTTCGAEVDGLAIMLKKEGWYVTRTGNVRCGGCRIRRRYK
jgi:hypothetical protein